MLYQSFMNGLSILTQGINSLFSSYIRWIPVLAIWFYQRFLSPVKGFSCAYRVYHNAESCSCYVKRIFIEQDLQTAITLSNKRFRDCSQANQVLMSTQEYRENIQNLIGRRKALRLFSFFSLGVFSPQVRGCPGVNACCSSLLDGDDDDDSDDS